jgi:hypothetical protein
MAQIIKFFWRSVSLLAVIVFMWGSIAIGFFDFVIGIPKSFIESRSRYFSLDQVKIYWGIEEFNSQKWKKGERSAQAVYLAFNKKTIGFSRAEVISLLGEPDGDYLYQDGELSYKILDKTKFDDKSGATGSRWTLFLKTDLRDKVKDLAFVRTCCDKF